MRRKSIKAKQSRSPSVHGKKPSPFFHQSSKSLAASSSQSFFTPEVQPKSAANIPDDKYEQEAGRMADIEMHMPEPMIQRACVNGVWETEYDGCSIPPDIANIIGAEHKDNPAGGSDTQFALPDSSKDRPCDRHDECYQTCHKNPDAKFRCDLQMYNDMMSVCESSEENEQIKQKCRKYAWIYFNGLMNAATIAFLERQRKVCSCEGGGLEIGEHLSGLQFPAGLTVPFGENVILNLGAGSYRPMSPADEDASFAVGGQLTWHF